MNPLFVLKPGNRVSAMLSIQLQHVIPFQIVRGLLWEPDAHFVSLTPGFAGLAVKICGIKNLKTVIL